MKEGGGRGMKRAHSELAQEGGKERAKEAAEGGGVAAGVAERTEVVRVSFGNSRAREVLGPGEEKEEEEEKAVGGKVLKMAVTQLNRDLFRDLMEHVYM